MNTHRSLSIVLKAALTIAGAAIVITLLTIAGITYLDTPDGSQRALNWIQSSFLARRGIDLRFEKGRFAAFSGFHFKNLQVKWGDAKNGGKFSAASIDLKWSFSLFGRALKVESLQLIQPRIFARSDSRGAPAEPLEDAKLADSGIEKLRALARRPPLHLTIRELAIDHLVLDYESVTDEGAATVIANDARLRAVLELAAGEVSTHGEFTLDNARVRYMSHAAAASNTTSAKVTMSVGWNARLHKLESGTWSHQILKLDMNVDGHELSSDNEATGKRAKTSVADATAKLRASTDFAATEPFSFATSTHSKNSSGKGSAELDFLLSKTALISPLGVIRISRVAIGCKAQMQDLLSLATEVRAEGIVAPAFFKRTIGAGFNARVEAPRDVSHATIRGAAGIDTIKALSFAGSIDNTHSQTTAEAKAKFNADRKLAERIKAAAPLATMGSPQIELQLSVQNASDSYPFKIALTTDRITLAPSRAPFAVALAGNGALHLRDSTKELESKLDVQVSNGDFGAWTARADLHLSSGMKEILAKGQATLTQLKVGPSVGVAIAQPVAIAFDLRSSPPTASGTMAISIPELDKKGVFYARDTLLKMEVPVADFQRANEQTANVELSQGRVTLANSLPIEGIELKLKARIVDGAAFTVERLHASVNGAMATIDGELSGNLKSKDVVARLAFASKLPASLAALPGQNFSGSIRAPIEASVRGGRAVSITGEIDFDSVSWSNGAVAIERLSGHIPFSEKLEWSAPSLRFSQLIEQNPFERANFERIRPLIQSAAPLSIASISWLEKKYGPFVGFFSVRQNMAFAHQFDLDLGTGRAYGELFLDFYPKTLRLGTLSRLTNLDLGTFLPKSFLNRVPEGNRVISGRSGFVIDLNKGTADGRVDVTSIGGPQLIAIINVLDPKFENEKMNSARSVLEYGYPTGVAISLAQGYMNMDIDLQAFGVQRRQSVLGIPLSSFISNATSDLVAQAKKGPLQ